MNRVFPLLFFLLFFSCSHADLPYLWLDMEELYIEGNEIPVYYEFSSESESQPCRIRLWDLSDMDEPVWDNEDRERDNQGHLNFFLGEGTYRLEFTVLSSRLGELNELPFLSETRDFRVEVSP